MDKFEIPETVARRWQQISTKLAQIKELIDDCHSILLLELNVIGKPLERLTEVETSVSGLSYLFAPQTEWIGGDSSDPSNFKMTLPHIARN